MTSLRLRLAKATDAQALQSFTCARPYRFPDRDPEPWASEVQGWIRGEAWRDTRKNAGLPYSQRLVLFDDADSGGGEILAVASYYVHDRQPSALSVRMPALAVALQARGTTLPNGSTVAQTCLELTLREVRLVGTGVIIATGLVHTNNKPCQRLLARQGFTIQAGMSAPPYDLWARRL